MNLTKETEDKSPEKNEIKHIMTGKSTKESYFKKHESKAQHADQSSNK